MKTLPLILVSLLVAFMPSCAKWENEVAANGGILGSYTGDYLVRNDSGGRIMDVWVLHNVIVQAEHSGAGWLFQDGQGNVIHLGGDVKVVRINRDIGRYHEYHAEFERRSYQELYASEPSPLTADTPAVSDGAFIRVEK